ncbi:MAG: hypothetical protein ACREH3_11435, partial [Geminicoccales bacterium]
MRRRRVERCLSKADAALQAGCAADARDALEEARNLDPHVPELVDLEKRIVAVEQPESSGTGSNRRWVFPVAAAGVFLAVLAILHFWLRPLERQPLISTPAAPDHAVPAGTAAPAADEPLVTVATDRITASEIRPRLQPLHPETPASAGSDESAVASSSPPVVEATAARIVPPAVAPAPTPV